ncbi:MAG: hypothetical protein A2653_03320 [Candidatus Zambryskibacteria bacterium RIFCSPHIGHO2_01_FULL_43_25]|uniref:GIY-YIG domain-containing protein n=1 Tax=Candidatus Zambryskibacteria bacterium RIFCSPLOWO2_01_FULL_45_21 TaxID=1802761 RepID=A0A1G2U1M3_9BACT|nr:MAG: hypothetical protein A2653_03320 [Candidatus Zambryskibacteria bacterium RIFCSPHIGHO2_01_FULL_43_25]OHB00166.1 MAG: hypothetical protein A3E94_01110 [Candidatus Zambryskibacteria bacterium RIFCSPHIGHO2_12_FULL_44_12b]OHB03431.1 MAG: hypothetical protein A3B14_02790 [Candidatus Zambryskibacteria bacterium RIFCSPLOWO2_01_FULL_45_21]
MFYNYVIESVDGKNLYIGHTSDIRKRLKEHNQGLNSSTKRYGRWYLIYYEACIDRSDALRREKYLKTTQGGRLLKRRLKEYFYKKKNLVD